MFSEKCVDVGAWSIATTSSNYPISEASDAIFGFDVDGLNCEEDVPLLG
jgi:hypothetical protein